VDSKSSDIYELYAISLITIESFKVALRFPEVIMTDATCKTNSSNRPLKFVCGLDSTGKTVWMSTYLQVIMKGRIHLLLLLRIFSFLWQEMVL
jgi:hypothetical protein